MAGTIEILVVTIMILASLAYLIRAARHRFRGGSCGSCGSCNTGATKSDTSPSATKTTPVIQLTVRGKEVAEHK